MYFVDLMQHKHFVKTKSNKQRQLRNTSRSMFSNHRIQRKKGIYYHDAMIKSFNYSWFTCYKLRLHRTHSNLESIKLSRQMIKTISGQTSLSKQLLKLDNGVSVDCFVSTLKQRQKKHGTFIRNALIQSKNKQPLILAQSYVKHQYAYRSGLSRSGLIGKHLFKNRAVRRILKRLYSCDVVIQINNITYSYTNCVGRVTAIPFFNHFVFVDELFLPEFFELSQK